jgi:hypothetical protein
MAKSQWWAGQILGLVKGVAVTPPAAVYLGLFKGDEGLLKGDGSVAYNEFSGGGYARKPIVFGAISEGVMTPSADIDFGVPTADWGKATHVAIMDALTGGHVLYYVPLLERPEVLKDGQFKVLKATDMTLAEG